MKKWRKYVNMTKRRGSMGRGTPVNVRKNEWMLRIMSIERVHEQLYDINMDKKTIKI